MDEKYRLERAALDYFIPQYNHLMGTRLQFQKHQDKPDFIVTDLESSCQVGIEVKHLFYKNSNTPEAGLKVGEYYEQVFRQIVEVSVIWHGRLPLNTQPVLIFIFL